MKKFILFLVVIVSYSASGQSFSVFNIDTTAFPTIKAKFYAFDKDGKQITGLSPGQINVFEDGVERKVLNVSCPEPKPPVPISLAISVDISGSMSYSNDGPPPIQLSSLTISNLVDFIATPPSEIALQSCDDKALILQDFTKNKTVIKDKLAALHALGNNDFVEQLLNPHSGLLNIAKTGKNKRIALIVTDAWWQALTEMELQQCINICNEYNIQLYAIIYTRPEAEPNGIKASLRTIAEKSGGKFYDGLISKEESEKLASELQGAMQGNDPCEIEWESDATCFKSKVHVKAEINDYQLVCETGYTPPGKSIARLAFEPNLVKFTNVPPGSQKDTIITVTAINSDFDISDITSKFPEFSITPTNFKLQKGQSINLKITFIPTDSGTVFSVFKFITNLCDFAYYVTGGYPGKLSKIQSLKLTHPNGGEKFLVGSDTVITWEGVLPDDVVNLSYSTDNGASWNLITSQASQFKYIWKNIPKTPSDQCLMKVSIGDGSDEASLKKIMTLGDITLNKAISCIDWNHDDSKIASCGSMEKSLQNTTVWHLDSSGTSTDHYTLDFASPTCLDWNSAGSYLVIGNSNGYITILDSNFTPTSFLFEHDRYMSVKSIKWSPDNKKFAYGASDGSLIVMDTFDVATKRQIEAHDDTVNSVCWSHDATRIITGSSDNTIKIWNEETGDILLEIPTPYPVSSVGRDPLSGRIASCGTNNTIDFWDMNTGDFLYSFENGFDNISSLDWSSDGGKIACCDDNGNINIWDAYSGSLMYSIKEDFSHWVSWNASGTKLACGGIKNIINIWQVTGGNSQYDVSDALWAIISPNFASRDIDMGNEFVGTSKDSLIKKFIENKSAYSIQIDSIQISGVNASEFVLSSGMPPFTVAPMSDQAVEFTFTPAGTGLRTAIMKIYGQDTVLKQSIRGTGVAQQLKIVTNLVDFGIQEIGSNKDTTVVLLKNVSNQNVTVTNTVMLGPDTQQFSVVSGGGSFTLIPNEERELVLRFSPVYIGRTNGQIGFEYNGFGSPASAQLYGQGIGGYVYFGDDSAYAGEHRTMKLMVGGVKFNSSNNLIAEYKAKVRFQKSILSPVDESLFFGFTADSTILEVEGTINANSDVLANIEFVAGLGSVPSTTLDILDFKWLDDTGIPIEYDTETESGTFKLLGICPEGGPRLINPDGIVSVDAKPNPSSGVMTIDMNLIENGRTTLEMYNISGKSVKNLFDKVINKYGSYSVTFETNDLNTGEYVLILKTSTTIHSKKIYITK